MHAGNNYRLSPQLELYYRLPLPLSTCPSSKDRRYTSMVIASSTHGGEVVDKIGVNIFRPYPFITLVNQRARSFMTTVNHVRSKWAIHVVKSQVHPNLN